MTLRIGTRGSLLARTQSAQVGELLGGDVELVTVHTEGDRDRTSPLASIGGTGVFVSEVRAALLDGRVDLAVHSFKDLPTAPAEGIALGAVPRREDPRDALVSASGCGLADLPRGARVGTGSPRRAAQLLRLRPDLVVEPIRGNIETRLGRAAPESGDLDAVVLAASGLLRAGRGTAITQYLDPSEMLPAPAQGALAVECRSADLEGPIGLRLRNIGDPLTRACALAERAVLATLEAGCSAPVGALAEPVAPAQAAAARIRLRALAIAPDASSVFEAEAVGSAEPAAAAELGQELARKLLADGAGSVLV